MTQQITFLLKSVARDAIGGEAITWVEYADDWAEVTPIRGREYFAAQQVEAETDTRFRVRYRSDINSAYRIRWREVDYDILDVINVEARDRQLELMCKTVAHA